MIPIEFLKRIFDELNIIKILCLCCCRWQRAFFHNVCELVSVVSRKSVSRLRNTWQTGMFEWNCFHFGTKLHVSLFYFTISFASEARIVGVYHFWFDFHSYQVFYSFSVWIFCVFFLCVGFAFALFIWISNSRFGIVFAWHATHFKCHMRYWTLFFNGEVVSDLFFFASSHQQWNTKWLNHGMLILLNSNSLSPSL